jgi:hypothetical protein
MNALSIKDLSDIADDTMYSGTVLYGAKKLTEYLSEEELEMEKYLSVLRTYTASIIAVTIATVCSRLYSEEEMSDMKEKFLDDASNELFAGIVKFMQEGESNDSI